MLKQDCKEPSYSDQGSAFLGALVALKNVLLVALSRVRSLCMLSDSTVSACVTQCVSVQAF